MTYTMHETLDDYAMPHQDSREWIPKKPESATDLQRESIILSEIKKKPYFQHNRLVEKIVKDHRSMAKTTCEKTIKRLLEKHLVRVNHDKNKKLYSITFPLEKPFDENHFKREIDQEVRRLEMKLPHFIREYPELPLEEKCGHAYDHLYPVFTIIDSIITKNSVTDPVTNQYESELFRLKSMINEVFNTIFNDRIDRDQVYTHLESSIVKRMFVRHEEDSD